MTTGTLNQTFEFMIEGIEFESTAEFIIPSINLRAKLEKEFPFQLHVQVENATEYEALQHANDFTRELYFRLLLRFAPVIELSTAPRPTHQSFTNSNIPIIISRNQVISGNSQIIRRRKVLPLSEVDSMARDVELRVVTPKPVTSTMLYTAINMYVTGFESSNKVVRFIVFYSALALASLFKSHKGNLSDVDSLMLGVKPAIRQIISPKTNKNETIYTKFRNDLIHSEERGCDPEKAILEIETHIKDFQEVVSLVFQVL